MAEKTGRTRTWYGHGSAARRRNRANSRGAAGGNIGKNPAVVYADTKKKFLVARGEALHFSEGVNFYKIVWLYVLGGLIGFFVEVVWCYYVYRRIEWHSAMAFTPFNPIYGSGAVILYLTLRKADKRNLLLVFFVAAAAGTLIELACSYLQESLFHSYSWDYRHLPYNFQGRVCLGMTVGWGLLGVAWVLFLCPALDKVISVIPQRTGKIVAAILAAVIAVDAAITVAAMLRWLARRAGLAPHGALGVLLDRFFPDVRMQFIFPRIKFFK